MPEAEPFQDLSSRSPGNAKPVPEPSLPSSEEARPPFGGSSPGLPGPAKSETPSSLSDSARAEAPRSAIDGMLALDPASVPCDRISTWILVGVIATAGLVVTPGLALLDTLSWLPAAGLLATWLVLDGALLWAGLRLSVLEFERTRYLLDDVGLIIHRGIVWRSRTIVPRSRVQHTDVSQGPVQRRFGLATLTVHTAGSEDASVALSGLRHEEALRLRDALVASAAARPLLRTGV